MMGPTGSRHFGDITYYGGDDRISVYDSNGKMRRWGMLVQQDKAAWVAVNPKDGLMYFMAMREASEMGHITKSITTMPQPVSMPLELWAI